MEYNIKETSDILNIKREDLCQSLFNYLFGNREDKGPRFLVTDKLTIPKGAYYGNTEPIHTCIGNYLMNFALFNENVYKIVGFINKRMDADTISDNEKKISAALLDDKISTTDVIDYIDRIQFFGFGLNSLMTASITPKVMFELPEVQKRKKELQKKYAKELAMGDVVVTDKVEKELLQLAKDIIGDDKGMELYDSGSKASFSNNYKLMNVMKGAMRDLETGGYQVSMSNYQEGIPKEETHLFANGMVASEYAKGVGTQVGGYLVKKYIAALQTVTLDEPHSDCGTEKTFDIMVNDFNKKLLLYRYIKDGKTVIRLTNDNINKYVGRIIHLYDPIYCTGEKLCNKCAGDLYYKLGIMNIGSTASKICSTIMNKSLKKKHDNTIKLYTLKNIDTDMIL